MNQLWALFKVTAVHRKQSFILNIKYMQERASEKHCKDVSPQENEMDVTVLTDLV